MSDLIGVDGSPAGLINEWRTLVGRLGHPPSQAFCAEFIASHGLSESDVDELLSALAAGYSAGSDSLASVGTQDVETNAVDPEEDVVTCDPLAWMSEDEPVPVVSTGSADDPVASARDDLFGDWVRAGHLSREDVAILATARDLSSRQLGEVLRLLREAGVELSEKRGRERQRRIPQRSLPGSDSVGHYLGEIGRYPLLDAAREYELWSLISHGAAARSELGVSDDTVPSSVLQDLREIGIAGRRAHDDLVCGNLRLVVSIARDARYESCGVELADRIQDGNLGLIHAADKFDASKGFKFSTYATWWIRQAIERGIADRGRLIRTPVHVHEKILKTRKVARMLRARLDREPTAVEIAEQTDMEPGAVQAVIDLMQPVRSLDELLGDDGDLRLSDLLPSGGEGDGRTDPANVAVERVCRADLDRFMSAVLSERDAEVLRRRYGLDTGEEETLDAIGTDLGVTRERIRQVQKKALIKLRESDMAAQMYTYLGDGSFSADPASRKTRSAS